MLKLGGTSEYEWVASVIGKALGLPVQDAIILNPSVSNKRSADGGWTGEPFSVDDTLVEISLFTSSKVSFVHAAELLADFAEPSSDADETGPFQQAQRDGQHHRFFYADSPMSLSVNLSVFLF